MTKSAVSGVFSAIPARKQRVIIPERFTRTINVANADGIKSVLALTATQHSVFIDHTDHGDYVYAIDDIYADDTHVWKLYINGRAAQQGAGSLIPRITDRISWRYVRVLRALPRHA